MASGFCPRKGRDPLKPVMKLYLTRCDGGRYMLTVFRPTIARIRGTDRMDAFERSGEPIAVRYLCEPGVKSLFGRTFPPLTPTIIELTAKVAA